MTKEQNVVLTFYLLMTALCGSIYFESYAAFFAIGFFLAFILKLANSLSKGGSHGGTNTTGQDSSLSGSV